MDKCDLPGQEKSSPVSAVLQMVYNVAFEDSFVYSN